MKMKNKPLKFGVVGLGSIARHHIKSIAATGGCELIAVTSSSAEKRKNAQTEHGVRAFSTVEEMVQLPELDVVCICTPSGMHRDPCIVAAQAGKHVITEKPLEINLARAQEMIDACRQAEVTLSCIFQNRYIPEYQSLVESVAQGKLGKLVLGNAYVKWYRPPEYYASNPWRGTLTGDGGAALINQSIHSIDQLINVMGPVKSVMGKVATLTHAIEGEDVGTAILEFENGALGTIEGSTAIKAGFPERIEVHGEQGSIVLEAGKVIHHSTQDKQKFAVDKSAGTASASSDPTAVDVSLHIAQFQDIVSSITNGEEPTVNGEEAMKALRVITAIYESSKSGKVVYL